MNLLSQKTATEVALALQVLRQNEVRKHLRLEDMQQQSSQRFQDLNDGQKKSAVRRKVYQTVRGNEL